MPAFFSPWLAAKYPTKKRRRKARAKKGSCNIKQRATVGGIRVAVYKKRVKGSRGRSGHMRIYARRIRPGGGC